MQSTHFKVQADVLSVGGGSGTSGSFRINDTIGDLAVGGGASSSSFQACSGFECFSQSAYLTFSLNTGTSSPGTAGGSVDLGPLSVIAIKGSNHSTINSIFLSAVSNGAASTITVRSNNAALTSPSTSGFIASGTGTLAVGTPGYGICVATGSVTGFTVASPYDGTCDTTTGHQVGLVDGTDRNLLTVSGQLAEGAAEVLVKASINGLVPAAADYGDVLTFIMTSTY